MSDKKRVLLVDDEPDLIAILKKRFQKEGFDTDVAYDGNEAMAKVAANPPDAIVLDVMMPDKDGYEVCKELKGDPNYRDIPILLLTAVVSKIPTTSYTHRMGMETEADDYVDKPVEPTELVRLVERLLKK